MAVRCWVKDNNSVIICFRDVEIIYRFHSRFLIILSKTTTKKTYRDTSAALAKKIFIIGYD